VKSLLSHHSGAVKNVVSIYECDWISQKKKVKEDLENFWRATGMSKTRPPIRLIPRVTLRGGFIETYRLKFSTSENPDFDLYFIDVNSLYSHIALTKKVPVGKYQVLTSNCDLQRNVRFQNGKFYFKNVPLAGSAALVTVTAPKGLLRPFLGYRIENEYNFYLTCRSCGEKKINSKCQHRSDFKRSFTSCYMISELEKAASLKYKIFFHEIHLFAATDYILQDFVKILASEKLKYSDIFQDLSHSDVDARDNICNILNASMKFDSPELEITPHNVVPNTGHKHLLKNMLNSFYGRFALHNNFNLTTICRTQEDFHNVLLNPHYSIVDMVSFADDILQVELMNHQQKVLPSRKGNLYITSEINALARIFIYEQSEEIEKRNGIVLSMDTDSILFAFPKSQPLPFFFNDSFGSFKHVLGADSEITDFYSLGPRNYSVVYKQAGVVKHVIKAKGLSLNAVNCQQFLNPSKYCDFIDSNFNDEVKYIYIPQMRKKIDKQSRTSKDTLTEFNFSNELHVKRFVLKQFENHLYRTFPYGYDFSNISDKRAYPGTKRKLEMPLTTVSVKRPNLSDKKE
jgi:hypothetical protein